MIEAIKQYVLDGATVEQIEAMTADDVRTIGDNEKAVITKPRLANLKRYALGVYKQKQRASLLQAFRSQFGGARTWLQNFWPDCEFDIDDEQGKPCIKIYPEGRP